MRRWEDTSPGVKTALAIATGFGFGFSPFASGTVGALWGLPLAWALTTWDWHWQLVAAMALASAATPFCDQAERWFGRKDDGRIVADEYLTFPIAVLGIPLHQAPLMLVVAFVVSRACDILKPWPARGLQACHGGFGIVIDDVVASLYALGINWAIYWFVYPLVTDWLVRTFP